MDCLGHTQQCPGLPPGSVLKMIPGSVQRTICGARDQTKIGYMLRQKPYWLDYLSGPEKAF